MRIPLFRSSLFKTPYPKQFEYKCRYYDPEKEKQVKGRKQIKNKYNRLFRNTENGPSISIGDRQKRAGAKSRPVRIIILIAMLSITFILYLYQIPVIYSALLLFIMVVFLFKFFKNK